MNQSMLAELFGLPNLPSDLQAVEAGMREVLVSDNAPLFDPSWRQVAAGGKRLRPALVIAAAAAGGSGFDADVCSGAVAVELVHTGSLVHDDIMDRAQARRGVPTINAKEGINQAILAGDYLLARAGVAAARVSKEVAAELAVALSDLCDGQSREVVDSYRADRTVGDYYTAVAGKTAALMRSAAAIGALCGRLDDGAVRALSAYGLEFGLAFQIIDDVLDVISTTELMGKPVGHDVKEGVFTLPLLLALDGDGSPGVRTRLPKDQTDGDGYDVEPVLDFIKASGAVEECLGRARQHNDDAVAALDGFDAGPVVAGLRSLPGFYLDWVLENRVRGDWRAPASV